MTPPSDNLRGAAFMMASMAGFAFNDALVKQIAGDIGLYPAIFLRGVAATLFLAMLTAHQGLLRWRPRGADRGLIGVRAVMEMATTVLYLTALLHLPLANASAILQSAPLVVTLGAAIFLGEPVGWRRYLAAAIGFGGVLMIVRPGGEGFNAYALLAVASVFLIAVRDLVTRRLSVSVPSVPVALITATLIMGLGAVGTVLQSGSLPDLRGAVLLVICAFALVIGYLFGVMSMRSGEIGFVSPFRYSILLWAILLGYLMFGERPDGWTLLGSAIVVATGLFTFWRERTVKAA